MIPAAHATTAAHLHQLATHWNDLAALAATRAGDAWPPASLNHYLRTIEEYDPMDRSAPVRLHILDTIRTIETALLTLADQVAAHVQQPTMTVPAPRRAAPAHSRAERVEWADRARRTQAAREDSADPRRWTWSGRRTAPQAAAWLGQRVVGAPGPFEPLTEALHLRIAGIAAEAMERLEHALGTARRTVPLTEPCHHCRATALTLHGGDGRPPAVVCDRCGRTWTQQQPAPAA